MRYLVFLVALAGCVPLKPDAVYSTDGKAIDVAYIILEPVCILICTTSVTTSGANSDGGGDISTSQSSTSTTSRSQ